MIGNVLPETTGPSAYEVEQRNRRTVLEEYQQYLNKVFFFQDKERLSSLDLVQFWVVCFGSYLRSTQD